MNATGSWVPPDPASSRIGPRLTVSPSPTAEEAAAIVAAFEALWPRPVVVVARPARPEAWRFSGRWWARPISARRPRPWF